MTSTLTADKFSQLLSNDTPLLDLRAPVEFSNGAFPSSVSIPLLDDEQRHLVGIEYKQAGRSAAMELGHKLVSGNCKDKKINQWSEFLTQHSSAAIYCFRGGQRSKIAQQWLADKGIEALRIEGGYKALRRHLLSVLEQVSEETDIIITAGKTGSGKTHLINQLKFSADLEGKAHHRGSAFGLRTAPQPTQINFENALAIDLLKLPLEKINRLFLEDESHSIGSVHLPKNLYASMQKSPLAIIESTLESRVSIIFNDYIISNYIEFERQDKENAEHHFSESLLASLGKIKRRLGPEAYTEVEQLMHRALKSQFDSNDPNLHRDWIELLLKKYYDPMYDYQLAKKHHRIVFRGDAPEFLSWANSINKDVG